MSKPDTWQKKKKEEERILLCKYSLNKRTPWEPFARSLKYSLCIVPHYCRSLEVILLVLESQGKLAKED